MLSQYTVKKTKINWQRLEGFCPRENNQFFWQIWYQTSLQIPTLLHLIILTSFFAICNVFFSKTNERKTEASLSHSQCQVFQRLQHHVHWRVNTYSAISFEEIRFLHCGKFAFWLWKAFVMSYSFCEPIKNHLFCTSFWSPKQEAMLVYNSIHPWARS